MPARSPERDRKRQRSREREVSRRSPEREHKRQRSRSRDRRVDRSERSRSREQRRDERERARDREARVRDTDGRDGREREGRDRDRAKERSKEGRDANGKGSERAQDGPRLEANGKGVSGGDEKEEGETNGKNANGAEPAKQPLSLEELLRKRKEEQEQLSKPVFLTKQQRQELALKRRQEEVAAQRESLALLRAAAAGGGAAAAAAAAAPAAPSASELPPPPPRRDERAGRGDRDRDRDRRGDRDRDRDRRDDRRGGRDDRRDRREGDRKADGGAKGPDEDRERELQLQMIKQQYLGAPAPKKKAMKPSDKFRFNFDWEATEDTSRDLNPLYNNPHEATLLFGRGLRGGMDRREQKKAAADQEAELLRQLRQRAGVAETVEDRQRDKARGDRADKYEGHDMKVDKHWTDKARSEMTERDWRIFREDFNISYRGANAPLPIRSWSEAHLPDALVKAVDRHGYKKPSPIQMAAIPLGLQQRDVIGIAETGSGKTAAFVLPMLTYIMGQPKMLGNPDIEAEGPYAVIMAPTRELAQQIEEETKQLAHYTDFRVVSVVGGQSIEDQGFLLRKGCEIVVATPGRMVDCLERSYAVLNQCNYVVLDEADRMIDLGFEPQVMGVLDAMPSTNLKPEEEDVVGGADVVYRTTYMFSATMPPAVERLARKYLRRPVIVSIGRTGMAAENVTQRITMVKGNEKTALLEQELEYQGEKRVIIFVNTKRQCDFVSKHLENLGYRCTVLHSGKTQEQRSLSLAGFREDKYTVLVATDVAGRGIDVPDVALVLNYEMPNNIESYQHRIGRTGRAGRKGTAVTFLTLKDTEVFYDLKKFLEASKSPVPPQLAHHEASKVKPGSVDAQKRDKVVFAKK